MVTAIEVAWQNKSIGRSSDFRGVLIMGLLAAWFYFVWQLLSLPPFKAVQAALPPLVGFALAKGQYMPDFGMIVAGFAAFHFRRELQKELDLRMALRVYLSAVVPLIAYLAAGVALLAAVQLAAPAYGFVPPWQDRLFKVQFAVVAAAIVFACLWPFCLHLMWTAIVDIALAGVILALIYYGMDFTLHWHTLFYMWPSTGLVDFLMGVCLCATMFRSVEYLEPVRGAMMVLGWMAMVMCSILAGPGLFFMGFLLVVSGTALGERSWFLPGEWLLLLWSRTALAIVMVQPALFTAWLIWGQRITGTRWIAVLALALATQLVATLLCLVIERATRRLTPAMPA
jgi:hypothetical protein